MKRIVIVGSIGLLALFGLTAAFGHSSAPTRATAKAASLSAMSAGRPEGPCVFPSEADLANLAAGTDLVVAGTVEGQVQKLTFAGTNNQPFTRYMLRVRSVVRGSTAESVLTIIEAGGVVQPILLPGPQVVFLQKIPRTDGLTTYFVYSGLDGIFLTRASGMTRECPHGVQRVSDYVTDGSNEATFSDRIRGLTPTTPPHK